jgi:hypothetical protein
MQDGRSAIFYVQSTAVAKALLDLKANVNLIDVVRYYDWTYLVAFCADHRTDIVLY